MAKPEPEIVNVDEDYTEDDESNVEECNTDDSEGDPTFDIIEETRSSLSRLSLKKSNSRISKVKDSDKKRKLDFEEVEIPKLSEVDAKSFENVEKIIQAGQVEKLKIDQCKVYLRKHGLRLTGKKEVLMERIREHLGILNGGGEQKYPVSSFVLNCKGDACTGDVVMFEQNVYEMYNIASRSATGPPCGTRVVAGRIVKESYGAAKQQHTFTIEVLWSKGVKPLPPLHPLLIKGRNLYRLNTMRQQWTNEAERSKALLEKHSRGFQARSTRETRIQEKEMRNKLREQRVLRNASTTIHKENQHSQPTAVKSNYCHQPPVQSQPNRILTEINRQTTIMSQPNQLKPQMNNIQVQKTSILGKPDNLLNSNAPQKLWANISEVDKHMNHQSYPSLRSPPRVPLHHLHRNDHPVHAHKQPSSIICSPPRSPLRNPTRQSYPSSKSPPWITQHHSYRNDQPVHAHKQLSSIICSPPRSPLRSPTRQQHCRVFAQGGHCRYGDKCKFLHEYRGGQSFNVPSQGPLHQNGYPRQICRHYASGRCYYDNNCKFLHVNRTEQR